MNNFRTTLGRVAFCVLRLRFFLRLVCWVVLVVAPLLIGMGPVQPCACVTRNIFHACGMEVDVDRYTLTLDSGSAVAVHVPVRQLQLGSGTCLVLAPPGYQPSTVLTPAGIVAGVWAPPAIPIAPLPDAWTPHPAAGAAAAAVVAAPFSLTAISAAAQALSDGLSGRTATLLAPRAVRPMLCIPPLSLLVVFIRKILVERVHCVSLLSLSLHLTPGICAIESSGRHRGGAGRARATWAAASPSGMDRGGSLVCLAVSDHR